VSPLRLASAHLTPHLAHHTNTHVNARTVQALAHGASKEVAEATAQSKIHLMLTKLFRRVQSEELDAQVRGGADTLLMS